MKVAVSACLIGKNCKYNGGNNYNQSVINYLKDKEYILICPEVFGDLPTPRIPSEISNDLVINKEGKDVTENFIKGANIALKMLIDNKIEAVILKENSPSCGVNNIYDGTFKGNKIKGQGIFTRLLKDLDIKIYSEKDIEEILKKQKKKPLDLIRFLLILG